MTERVLRGKAWEGNWKLQDEESPTGVRVLFSPCHSRHSRANLDRPRSSTARPQWHLQQQHLPAFGGVALIDVPRQAWGAKKSGRAVLAGENLLSATIGCPSGARFRRSPDQGGQ